MRNSQKLKLLLLDNDLSISMPSSEIEMMVSNKSQHVCFMVTGKNISDLVNKALKLSNANKKQFSAKAS